MSRNEPVSPGLLGAPTAGPFDAHSTSRGPKAPPATTARRAAVCNCDCFCMGTQGVEPCWSRRTPVLRTGPHPVAVYVPVLARLLQVPAETS